MKRYQEEVDAWFKKQGWAYWEPLAITARLFEECGEFARLVNHVYGPKRKKLDEKKQDMEEELGDIVYTLICFANSHNISLDDAIRKSMDKVTERDKDRYTPTDA
ncbi:MAG TPA: nucleotide pyrophosphohydrolase [Candidatus Paceibacterota bacterium]|nr:nucleotide pyrophosphohydrolase [Candidatus Paceibacterota bacterium]